MMLRRSRTGLLLALCAATICGSLAIHGLLFVSGHRLPAPRQLAVSRPASPALAPAPVRETLRPQMPPGIDDRRFYKEGVRWLTDRDQVTKPPAWQVLLLRETYRKPSNTLSRVAAGLVAVLGLEVVVAKAKAAHAMENFFSVVHTSDGYGESVRAAQELQHRGLVVRVVPAVQRGTDRRKDEDEWEPEVAPAARRSV
eukprot:TRINITY_DN7779_c0_g1_i1.p1 TRINITY_DN7779_c0_g1~~TRINITY_DN7779_c0_g1_i1.p1  ORF type:complete len:198 (-),score=28.42 TRINITY_DN7779_c0_g1_i1:637-1230(-)